MSGACACRRSALDSIHVHVHVHVPVLPPPQHLSEEVQRLTADVFKQTQRADVSGACLHNI